VPGRCDISADTEPGLESWLKLNAEYASVWPNITIKREPPADAKAFDGVADKLKQYFSPKPGQGD
jgi:ferredoxin